VGSKSLREYLYIFVTSVFQLVVLEYKLIFMGES